MSFNYNQINGGWGYENSRIVLMLPNNRLKRLNEQLKFLKVVTRGDHHLLLSGSV